MTSLEKFKDKLKEYETNSVSAFMGRIQITQAERDHLLQLYANLSEADKGMAAKLLEGKGVDVPK